MEKSDKQKSEIIQNICAYDGYATYGICLNNRCQLKGFICLQCWLIRHTHHQDNTLTFPQIQVRVKQIIRLIQQIAFQFSLNNKEDYSEYLENFTQYLWLLELNFTQYQSKKLDKEIRLLQQMATLNQIRKQVYLYKQNHEKYFNQLKQLLFRHSKILRDHHQTTGLSINQMIKFLLFCTLMIFLIQYLQVSIQRQ